MSRADSEHHPARPTDPRSGDVGAAGVTRRRLLQGTGALLAGLAVAGCSDDVAENIDATKSPTTHTPPLGRPNILIVLADDMGFSDLGCFGAEISTPNLDALAASGRLFTDMHNNARCCPSRASLLTGLYPTQTGVGFMTHNEGSPAYQGHLNRSCVTLAEALGKTGYRTAISGKWHVAPTSRSKALPARRGFDRSYCQMGGGDYYTPNLYLDGDRIASPTDPSYWLPTAVTDFAVERIKEYARGSDPFFLYVGYKNPHFPLQAHPDEIAAYRGAFDAGWDELRTRRWEGAKAKGVVNPQWTFPSPTEGSVPWDETGNKAWQASRMEVYAAQVTGLDSEIGRLLATLDDTGTRDNTLVMFLSDNGACAEVPGGPKSLGQVTANGLRMEAGNIPGLFPGPSNTFQSYGIEWANVSNSPFRKYKRWLEEGGISSPAIASWPARLAGGGADHSFLHFIDVMPTLLELAGAPYPRVLHAEPITPVEGESFASVLTSSAKTTSRARTNPVFWEHMGHRAARHGRWKVVSDLPTGKFELFDMLSDRTETRNVAAAHPDIAHHLSEAWYEWKTRTGVREWIDHLGYRPD